MICCLFVGWGSALSFLRLFLPLMFTAIFIAFVRINEKTVSADTVFLTSLSRLITL